jgi:hypothetical protein
MRAKGFPWRPRVGDWFVNHLGYCEFVASHEHASAIGGNGDAFLPNWNDCRHWLATRGWGDPEFRDEDGWVGMFITHRSGRLLQARGVSDLDCLYQIILQILFGVSER